MGGVSAAVSDGIGAAFTNPANLMIRNHGQGFQFGAGWAAFHTTAGADASTLASSYMDQAAPFQVFGPPWSAPETDGRLTHASFDAMVAGMSLTQPGFGLSLAWRIRGENTYSSGAGWSMSDPASPADHHLKQNLRVAHEIGLGVAWEYELISGWLTDLSKLFVGIQPKVVIPGMMVDQVLVSHHAVDGTFVGSYALSAAGAAALHATGGLGRPLADGDLLQPTGIGGGIDMGVTYIIGMGNEQSLGTRRRQPTRNSLRFSASVSDLGLIRYADDPVTKSSGEQTRPAATRPGILATPFHGAPGQVEVILAGTDVESDIVANAETETGTSIYHSLPTLMRAGGALQLNRFLIAGDIQVPLSLHPYYGEERSIRLGAEIKPIRMIPLRAGAILQENRAPEYTAGFGLDFRNLDFSVSTRFRVGEAGSDAFRPVGATLAALQIRL